MAPTGRRMLTAVLAAVLLAGAAACAGVPEDSPVKVLRDVGAGDAVEAPPAPVAGANVLDVARGFVRASSSSSDKHGAARRFLTPAAAQDWNDGAALTVLEGQIDTVPITVAGQAPGTATVRIRGNRVGRLTPAGAFEPDDGQYTSDLELVQRDGQWRIARLPEGVVVDLDDFRGNYRAVPVWFVDPARKLALPDVRYLPGVPSRTQPARMVEMLLGGPSSSLAGAAVTLLAGAELRANVAAGPDGVVVVDLTRIAPPDDAARRLIAAQIMLSLSELNVLRVRILVDGEPLVAGKPDWSRDDVAASVAEPRVVPDPVVLVASGGRVGVLSGAAVASPIPGPAGNGGVAAESAATSVDAQRLAVVARVGAPAQLLVGRVVDGIVDPVGVQGTIMTRPTWSPSADEVWTVVNGRQVWRVGIRQDGPPIPSQVEVGQLTALGTITDLRLSRDGVRVLAVVDGGLYVGAIVRGLDGTVSVMDVRRLRAASLGTVVSADWRTADSIIAITRTPGSLIAQVGVDGLALLPVSTTNLTPPLTTVAASADRPLLVTDQTGMWTFVAEVQDAWRLLLPGAGAVPSYPG